MNNIASTITSIMGLDFFRAADNGKAMLFFFEYSSGANDAHAIAIHRLDNGTFQFFDPNYGVFAASSADKLKDSVIYLVGTVYPSQNRIAKVYTITTFA